ncbi:TetR-like C-terminal domain-containing protein [Actinomycetospora termitidis]|uniref:TetR-like C-terminal domain-containing protein n=1 Tax=Actinomycetospora termitidis TaxID=3053470 RepID=A0ABT7M6E6_9PSEU|nr:TetR-like C-terminal domain-containing protein [Actinomycetospora sp. Odt1-22]MDL5156108.1 TetR-like C-terminal domain-containing protein [Actinomycetospora sp. Odt1-22]
MGDGAGRAVGRRPPGRPRDERLEDAVLDTAHALLLEGGLDACTIEAVSRRSGIGKPAIYRRWPHRTALAVDAFARRVDTAVRPVDTGDAVEDLVALAGRLAEHYREREGIVYAELLAVAVREPDLAEMLADRFFAVRRHDVRELWQAGIDRGQLAADVDPDDGIDLLFGPAVMRLVLAAGTIDPPTARRLARLALRGVAQR